MFAFSHIFFKLTLKLGNIWFQTINSNDLLLKNQDNISENLTTLSKYIFYKVISKNKILFFTVIIFSLMDTQLHRIVKCVSDQIWKTIGLSYHIFLFVYLTNKNWTHKNFTSPLNTQNYKINIRNPGGECHIPTVWIIAKLVWCNVCVFRFIWACVTCLPHTSSAWCHALSWFCLSGC